MQRRARLVPLAGLVGVLAIGSGGAIVLAKHPLLGGVPGNGLIRGYKSPKSIYLTTEVAF